MAKFLIIGCNVLWRELSYFASISPNTFEFKYLKQGLHQTPELLRKELQQSIDSAGCEYSAILIGYGLCSNGLEGIIATNNRLVIMKGHDCITFLLGSKERYKEYFDKNPGTYWYTPGWIETNTQPSKERYEKVFKEYMEKYGEDNAEYLMEMEQDWFRKYTNAAYVDFGFFNTKEYKEYTKKCAEWLKWNYDELTGDMGLIKDFINGSWDDERFLIVEPGEIVVASHDDRIIDKKQV